MTDPFRSVTTPGARSWARHWRSLAVAVAMLLGAGLASAPLPAQAAAGDVGVEGRSYSGTSTPTGTKRSESVVWWNDGSWWSHMWDTTSRDFHIFRLDRPEVGTQSWIDTGVAGETRPNTHSDVLWDGTHLYVASHAFVSDGSSAVSGTPSYLFRFSYNSATRTYTRDSGFPVSINNYKTETLAVDQDSTGKLWATWQQGNKIYVNRTNGDDTSWGTPFVLPTSGSSVTVDDTSGVIAFGGNKIGVMWSNELTQAVYFAVHEDGQPDTTWRPTETASSGPEIADDHINLKAFGGHVYAATKTSMDKPADPLIMLLVRDPSSGSWARHTIGTKGECGNRAMIMIDEENRRLHAFYTQPAPPAFTCQSGGAIYEKTTPLDAISFESGSGTPVMLDADSPFLHNVASTKQNVDSESGIALLGVNTQTTRYWHTYLPITPAPSPPVAGFSATPTTGTAPLVVDFTDTSTGSPTAWSWDFGDGSTSTNRNPSHTYQTAGTYTVSLTVTNTAGSDTVTRTDHITVQTAPAQADFSATPTTGTAPLVVDFTDTSTGSPTAWSWDFGDGSTSTNRNPSHTYQTAGTYTVSLTVTNTAGSDTVTRTDHITVQTAPAQADFSATPTTGTAPLVVDFTDTSTGSPTAWSWDFGDGSTSTIQSPSHTYQTAGTYTVSLTVTNAAGSDTVTREALVNVTNAPDTVKPTVTMAFPTADATVSGTVDLAANASDAGGVVKVEWWLDGVLVATDRDGEPWTMPWNSATVADGGHKIFAKAKDTAGNYGSSAALTFTVSQAPDTTPPVVSITAPATGASVAGSTDLEATANDGVGVVAVRWQVDGAEVAADTNGAPWSAIWDTTTVADGNHTIVAVASDAAGNIGTSTSIDFTVSNVAGPGPLFSDDFESGDFSAWTAMRTGADGAATVGIEGAKTGTFGASLSATANTGSFAYARRTLIPRSELTVSGDFRITQEGASGGNVPLFRLFDSSGARIISLARQNLDANKVRITHGGSSATTTGRLALNTWGHVELHVVVGGGGTSTVEVSVDGVLAYQTTTADLGTDNLATVQIGNDTAKQTFRLDADNIEVGQ